MELIRKTNEDALVQRRAETAAGEKWWEWVDRRIERELDVLREATGQVIGMKAAQVRGDLTREIDLLRRDIDAVRREMTVLKNEVAVERRLESLRESIPSLPDIEGRITGRQTDLERTIETLERALDETRSKMGDLRVENSQLSFALRRLEGQKKPTVTVTLNTPEKTFRLSDNDPAAMEGWRRLVGDAIESNPDASIDVKHVNGKVS